MLTDLTKTVISSPFEASRVRLDFPALSQTVYDQPLVYLDNAATTQKPRFVIDRIAHFYENDNSNVHRGVHHLSQRATDAFEQARIDIGAYINAKESAEIIFTRGTTESINLIAQTFGSAFGPGDRILVSHMEHHSNIVPWQLLCKRTGAELDVIPVEDDGQLDYDAFVDLLTSRTRLVSVVHTSNSLGTVNPIQRMVAAAHDAGIPVAVDAAQALPHGRIDVQNLDCDFLAFSGHKMFGPTGVGVLYGKKDVLEELPPYQGGGDMIEEVSFDGTTFNSLPHRLEAGTPNIAGVIGLGATVEYLSRLDWTAVAQHEADLLSYATECLLAVPGTRLIGTAPEKAAVISFNCGDAHPYDVGTILDRLGVAVRTGHHCTMPLMTRYGVPGTVRASFALYNMRSDVDALIRGIEKVTTLLG